MRSFTVSFILFMFAFLCGCNRDVHVESVSIYPDTFNLAIGEEARITSIIYPPEASNKTVRWIVDTVALIENETIKGVSEGYSTIRCIAEDGFYSAGATVFVGDIAGTFKGVLMDGAQEQVLEENVELTIERILSYDNKATAKITQSANGLPFDLSCKIYITPTSWEPDLYVIKGETYVRLDGKDTPVDISGSYKLGTEFVFSNKNNFQISFLHQDVGRNIFFVGKKDYSNP